MEKKEKIIHLEVSMEWKKQGSEEWLEMRRSHIMASDAPVIMEVSPFKSIDKLWEQKLTGETDYVNSAMKKGTELEPVARELYIKETGVTMVPDVVFHPNIKWMGASLDGISFDGSKAVEIKYTTRYHDLAKEGKVPDMYFPQLQHQLAVLGIDEIDYYSFNGEEGVIVTVKRNEQYIDELIKVEQEFYNCLIEARRPISKKYEQVDDPSWDTLTDVWKHVNSKLKELKEEETRIRNLMIEYCQGRNLLGNEVKVLRTESKGRIIYKDIPELEGVNLEAYRSDPVERYTISEVPQF